MEEKKSIKISLGTLVCIIIIFILIIALVFMYFYYNNSSKNTDNISNEISNNQTKGISKLDESKDIVYSSYSKNSNEYSYSIPYININSDDVSKINKEIETYYKPLVEEELKNKSDGLSITMETIKYNSYINDNILSLIIASTYPNDCVYYKVYNLDIYQGTIITNSDILNMKSMNGTEFLDTLKKLYENKFVSLYGSKEKFINNLKSASVEWTESEIQEKAKIYESQLNKTISTENYSIKTPMFLNENGKICVIATIYSMAGADTYEHIIETNI